MPRLPSLLILLAVAVAGDAVAHHSQVGIFDSSRRIEVTGVIKSVSWRNPHGRIILEVRNDAGEIEEWEAETASISILRNRGVDGSAIVVGERVTIAGAPSVRGLRQILASNVLLPSDYEFTFGGANAHFPAGKAGRIVGHRTIEANVAQATARADGLFRVWSTNMSDPAAFPMFKGGYPLNDAGRAQLAEWNPIDNVLLRCGTKGMPLIMITPLPIELVRQGEDILMRIEEYDVRRLIHMGSDAAPPAQHTQFGFSRGRWEGRTLIVETTHVAAGYFDHEGTAQSDQIRLVERFIPNSTYDRVDYRLEVTDPVYFTEPFELTRYFVWKPENSVHPYECLDRF